ncbi:MAG: CCA tRNA nucleotidyltransferase [Phycisphaeraceae bacterium]|nr:CCA tRNA nucleotidyltransferase [Phycisphaeraceae bacterium]
MARASDPVKARRIAAGVVRRLRDAGFVAYFAGGCVRDELLGLQPTDYDVATDAAPGRVRELFPRTAEVGAAFGVILVHDDGVSVEVATFRSDGPYSDARRPDVVHFSDPRSDALRRDFTINALFLDPLAEPEARSDVAGEVGGHVVDFVGGLADLKARVIRAVGDPDKRLAEDHLRALRAVRFTARLGFSLDARTADAVRRHAAELRGVSRERIGDELRRMMAHPSRGAAVELLQRLGLDAPVLESESMQTPVSTLDLLGGVGEGREEGSPTPPLGACLAAWAIDRHGFALAGRQIASAWRRALNLSNDETDQLSDILGVATDLVRGAPGWLDRSTPAQKRSASRAAFEHARSLVAAADPDYANRIRIRVEELAREPGGLAPPPWVTGDDLVAMGQRPGPRFKAILDAVYDAQLERSIVDKAGALELARQLGV